MSIGAEEIRVRDEKSIAAAWRIIHSDGDCAMALRSVAEKTGVAISSMI
ncbi:hypothetical protein [Brachybacterium nesterenkovii]